MSIDDGLISPAAGSTVYSNPMQQRKNRHFKIIHSSTFQQLKCWPRSFVWSYIFVKYICLYILFVEKIVSLIVVFKLTNISNVISYFTLCCKECPNFHTLSRPVIRIWKTKSSPTEHWHSLTIISGLQVHCSVNHCNKYELCQNMWPEDCWRRYGRSLIRLWRMTPKMYKRGRGSTISKGIALGGVIKWQNFPRYWTFVREIHRWPVNPPHKGQWHGTLIFSLICAWTNGWSHNGDAGDLKRHCAHDDVTVMGT